MRAFAALYRLVLRTVATRGRLVGFLLIALVGVVVAWQVARSYPDDPVRAAAGLVDVFGLTFLVPVAALVFGTASLGDPTDDSTLVYLWLRPVTRWQIALAAYGAALSFVVPLAVAPTVAAAAVISTAPGVVGGTTLAALLAAVAYTGLFVLLGLLTNRALVWGIGYLLILESFVARGGRSLGALSVHAHAVSVLSRASHVRLRPLDYFALATGVVACLTISVTAAALTTRRLWRAEVP